MPDSPHAAAAHPSERRQSRRFPCDFAITIEWGEASLAGRVTEISGEGMFIELNEPLWIGARFEAHLALKNSVKIECTVRRVAPRSGMAVTYGVSGDSDRAAISSLLEQFLKK